MKKKDKVVGTYVDKECRRIPKISKQVQSEANEVAAFSKKFMDSQKDLDPRIAKAVDEQFMTLL